MTSTHMHNELANIIFGEIIAKINNNTLQISNLPDVITKINTALSDDRKTTADIAAIIQHDVTLSLRVIQIANSPMLRGVRKINTVSEAVNRIGISLVKNLALCVLLNDKMHNSKSTNALLIKQEITTSVQRSAYGQLIAKYYTENLKSDSSLLIGLFSKVGQLVVIGYINDTTEYNNLTTAEINEISNSIADTVGTLVLTRWNLSGHVIDAIYGDKSEGVNIIDPVTYKDIYELTNQYLDYKAGNLLPIPTFGNIDKIVDAHKDELNAMLSLFN